MAAAENTSISEEAEVERHFVAWQARLKNLRKAARATRRQFGIDALIRVGDGRGFVVDPHDHPRLVITAAHCLPEQPPAIAIAGDDERTYANLLGPLGQATSVSARCVFVDAISDIAVLGSTDFEETFDALVNSVKPLPLARTAAEQPAQLVALDGTWFPCIAHRYFLLNVARLIEAGMSGSPILDAKGRAIGVVAAGCESDPTAPHGPQPILFDHLPGWLLRSFRWAAPAPDPGTKSKLEGRAEKCGQASSSSSTASPGRSAGAMSPDF